MNVNYIQKKKEQIGFTERFLTRYFNLFSELLSFLQFSL